MTDSTSRKLISVVAACYNEQENVEDLYQQVTAVFDQLGRYDFEMIFIDNCSTDDTPAVLRRMAAAHPRVKIILNARNFGAIRSGFHGMIQGDGDAVIAMASDLQDPPALIPEFIAQWEKGYKVVIGIKNQSEESSLFYWIRSVYYRLVNRLADIELNSHSTGFGLYDRHIIGILRQIDDPYPYFRGLISDIGFESAKVFFKQPVRQRGFTKNNLYTLYDTAMLGITNHTKVPLRLATLSGFAMALMSLFVAVAYLAAKLIFWNSFPLGMAPVIIGLFLFCSVQLFFIGILGEYIGAIHTQVMHRPRVVERERINF